MKSLFGTDGIRGIAYEPPLDRATVIGIGLALARNLDSFSPKVLLGRDTRRSGPDLERWLMSGLAKGGATAESAGVITTPAVAFLTRSEGFDAGVVLSASHNPYRDNGIKLFTAAGSKSSADLEARIARDVARSADGPEAPETLERSSAISDPDPRFEELYLDHLLAAVPHEARARLPKIEIALDCANGAGYRVGPRLLRELGVVVHPLFAEPNGENINHLCGSTYMSAVSSAVVERGCDLGAALDGDGDRLLMVDGSGRVVDGDALLLLCARRLKKEGRARAVVATVMSNMALERALDDEGMDLYRAAVGDKFVAQEMAERNIILGGEQSGHIIFGDYGSTGDGLLTLLQVLRVLALEGRSLEELGRLDPFPQVLVNVRVRERPEVRDVPALARAIDEAERRLGSRGRVLVRYSGTEPLLRIMMEGPERAEIVSLAKSVEDVARAAIGETR
ncbi:MAG TPA: phosphoglucosamine mutase [Vicinamibacteria bacterium]|nr:phosphoglucosamine mutase [Vicinamibacteria bacterium]